MPRPLQRACLESGLKPDINRLVRRGFIQPGAVTGPVGIQWTDIYFDEEKARGIITADMADTDGGWFRIQIGQLDQRIILEARPRHFGGWQWFFRCPDLNRRAMVLLSGTVGHSPAFHCPVAQGSRLLEQIFGNRD